MSEPQVRVREVALFLFVAGDSVDSLTAYGNIQLALGMFEAENFELELINVFEFPERALEYRVLITPTLYAPSSGRRLVGDLSKWSRVHQFLQTLAPTWHAPC